MFALAVTAAVVFALILIGEFLWRALKVRQEFSRKFIHISVGAFAAFWPWFLSWNQIKLLSVAFLIVILASRFLTIFRSIHLAERRTFGEIFYALSIGLCAFITHDKFIFMAAILSLSLADGLAAVIGMSFGKHGQYKIFGHKKTVAGTTAFWCCSVLILSFYFIFGGSGNVWPVLLWLPLLSAALENVGILGIDNLLVPAAVALVLAKF